MEENPELGDSMPKKKTHLQKQFKKIAKKTKQVLRKKKR